MPFPLEMIAHDVQRAIEARIYYPALLVTLTIPEICMGLMLSRSHFVKQKHYIEFVNTYTTPQELGLDGASCYQLRGGIVHRADLRGHPFFEHTHVIFTTPETGAAIHGLSLVSGEKNAAVFDAVTFSQAMLAAMRRWYMENGTRPQVMENLKSIIRTHPNGLAPFIRSGPVVASGD